MEGGKERKKLHHQFHSLAGIYIGILETFFLLGNTLLGMSKRGLPGVATSGFLALGLQWLLLSSLSKNPLVPKFDKKEVPLRFGITAMATTLIFSKEAATLATSHVLLLHISSRIRHILLQAMQSNKRFWCYAYHQKSKIYPKAHKCISQRN